MTDAGMDLPSALDQSHYCIWCHEQGKDSCAHGLLEKAPAGAAPADNPFKKSPFGVTLAGCPLEEKISEFHKLRAEGWPLAALAIICVDNPLVAATGHRICNDCMKSCIYQKTDPSTFRRRRRGSSRMCWRCPGASRSIRCSRGGIR